MVVDVRPAISHGTITLICAADTKVGVPAIPSKVTWTPASVELTVPWAFTVNTVPDAGDAGPRLTPLIAINSPGAIAPNPLLIPLFETVVTEGVGAALTVSVTFTVIGEANTPGALMLSEP